MPPAARGRPGLRSTASGSGSSGRRLAAKPSPPAVLPAEVLRRLASDPLFAVMTGDGQHWIDPFTGQAVPASTGRERAAQEYLLQTGVWNGRQTLGIGQLEVERWRHDLLRMLPFEARLRVFAREGAGWVNPYSGDLVAGIVPEDGKVTSRVVLAMARHLATSPDARAGRMLAMEQINARAGRGGPPTASPAMSLTGTLVHVREPRGVEPVTMPPVAQPPAAPPLARPAPAQQTPPLAQPALSPRIPTPPPSVRTPLPDARTADLRRAGRVQDHMFADLPRIPGYAIALHFEPCDHVSGDFYEAMRLPDGRMLVAVGDVSGHGMQAALVVATALKTLRMLARSGFGLIDLIGRFNDEIKADLMPGQFLTMSAVLLDADAGRAEIVRAGHHPVLLSRVGGRVPFEMLGETGMAIGIGTGPVFKAALRSEEIQLAEGDVLWQWTDGLDEAANADGDQFGVNRVLATLLEHDGEPSQQQADALVDRVKTWRNGSLDDDLTIVGLAVVPIEGDEEPEA